MDGRQKGLRVAAIRRVVFCVPGWPVTRFKDLVSSIRPSFCLLTPACPVKLRQHHFTGVFCLLPPIFPLFHVVFFCLLTTDSCILLQHSSSPCFFLPDWSSSPQSNPLWLTAAICYDATDLSLAADLRDQSDVFAIPAFNRDVTTFDQMALALHYHMFQLVVVANNGGFGGSNAYAPYREECFRQVLHLHGQPQATVAFLEIDDIAAFLRRRADSLAQLRAAGNPSGSPTWKFPPAGQ